MTSSAIRKLLIAAAMMAAAAIYWRFNPAESVWMPKCFLHYLTGIECPGCGAQRCIHALLHLDFRGAARANMFLLLALPYILLLGVCELQPRRHKRLRRALHSRSAIITLLILTTLWTILRNIPLLQNLI